MKRNQSQVRKDRNTNPIQRQTDNDRAADNPKRPGAHAQPASARGPGRTVFRDGLLPFNPDADHCSCICFFDREANAPIGQIPLTAAEFMAVIRVNGANGSSDTFVADAIREKLATVAAQGGAGGAGSAASVRLPGESAESVTLSVSIMLRMLALVEKNHRQALAAGALVDSLLTLMQGSVDHDSAIDEWSMEHYSELARQWDIDDLPKDLLDHWSEICKSLIPVVSNAAERRAA